jgi:DDE family transposase
MHDTTDIPSPSQLREQLQVQVTSLFPPLQASEQAQPSKPGRGRPRRLPEGQLWLGLLWCVLEGMHSYQDLWRFLGSRIVGSFAPVQLTDDAIVKRLEQAGLEPLQQLLLHVNQWLATHLQPAMSPPLATFATQIVALDETTLDAVARHLSWQRLHPKGHPALLPGKLAGLFDVRQQCWLSLQFFPEALQNCKVGALSLVAELPWHSLLLFDLGYFSFAWFDYLSSLGYWWISRLREKTSYRLLHVYYCQDEILDALIWLGSSHGSRASRAVRLVRFCDGSQLRMYLTNVLDPRQLSMVEIAQLYARRWDIELAFLTLKEALDLHHWWSSKLPLILQQIWVVLIVAHLMQRLRIDIALHAGVDPFAVSLPLLIQYVPRLILQRQSPIDWVLTHGHRLGFIRPATRLQMVAPHIPLEQMTFPPADLVLVRKARYVQYRPRPGRPSYNKRKRSASRSTSAPSHAPS